jgi:serine/threonine-protein kinase
MGVVVEAYDRRLDRRVALKLLRPQVALGNEGEAYEARLLREAQAMARLNDPHVVHVYDAGRLEDGRVFIAMEYVEGQTLRQWCQRPRTWRELLRAYVAAARGLVAAHAAGIIHRDFKADNVLVGEDGRVRVTDFGVARSEFVPSTGRPTSSSPALPPSSDTETWETPLTLPGSVMGTLKYMAPELLQGQPADARSDLFAFCVALYEALYDQPAFPGSTPSERAHAQRQGRVSPPPASTQVPGWVTRAVLRGLALEPRQRPHSMEALVAALTDDPEVRRRARLRTLALVSTMAALAGLAVVGWTRSQGPGCADMRQRLGGAWDEPRRAQVKQALLGTGLPYAPDTAERVSTGLDTYAQAWVRLRTEVCEAGRGQLQPQSLTVLQVDCLERQRKQLQAVVELLARGPDKELLPKALQTVEALPAVELCADLKALTAAVPPPSDPAVRARVDSLQEEVDRLEALRAASKHREGLTRSEELLRQVAEVDYSPLRARALLVVSRLHSQAAEYAKAEALLRQALLPAARAQDDALMSQAWSGLVVAVARQSHPEQALPLVHPAELAAERTGKDVERAEFLEAHGIALKQLGRKEESRALNERALALKEKALGPEHPSVARSLNNVGILLVSLGQPEQGQPLLERSLEIKRKTLGPEHPSVAGSLDNLGQLFFTQGRYAQAQAYFEQAVAQRERLLGAEHPDVATSLSNLAVSISEQGRHGQARVFFERALAVREKTLGPKHPDTVAALNNLALSLSEQGQYEQALAGLERVQALRQEALGPDGSPGVDMLGNQGLMLLELGRYEEARARFERALALARQGAQSQTTPVLNALTGLGRLLLRQGRLEAAATHLERARTLAEKQLEPEHPLRADVLLALALREEARGRAAEARSLLERALRWAQGNTRAEVQFTLARVLWLEGQLSRALALASEAQVYYRQVGHQPRLASLSQWLSSPREQGP